MLNPWLTLPFRAVRLGWEAQSILADEMMRLAGLGISDQKAAGNFIAPMALPTVERKAPEGRTLAAEAAAPGKRGEHRQAARMVRKIQKKRGLGSKRRRPK
jgi:hypothetical protein